MQPSVIELIPASTPESPGPVTGSGQALSNSANNNGSRRSTRRRSVEQNRGALLAQGAEAFGARFASQSG